MSRFATPASPFRRAPAAKQMGKQVAQNILRRIRGDQPVEYRYRDYGQLATIGRSAAVAYFGKFKLSGYPAWLMWLIAPNIR